MRDMIAYMNARKAAKAASGGAKQDHTAKYARDYEPDAFELAMSAINSFALWAEASRARYLAANDMAYADDSEPGEDWK